MKRYQVALSSPVSTSFRCQKAANSLDIDAEKKSVHELDVSADLDTEYALGLIVGASGSGKTTLAQQIWGEDVFNVDLDLSKPVIEQFPDEYTYDECASMLTGVGLTSVPCWIRPAHTLSNGQRVRAEVALQLSSDRSLIVVDEWTSVVDRTVAKIMSHCVQKFARKTGKRIVLLSCHYDVIEWLEPDWIIDCNKQEYLDRRLLRWDREEKLHFDVRDADGSTWKHFSKYHYLSDKLPGGHTAYFGLYHGTDQVGFSCFANYVPWRNKKAPMKMHSNRIVIHPDYVGFGLGVMFANECSRIMADRGYHVFAKLSALPLVKSRLKQPDVWKLSAVQRHMKVVVGGNMKRKSGFRTKVKTYTFEWVGSPTKFTGSYARN